MGQQSDRIQKQDGSLPTRTAWHLLQRIREAWEDTTGAEPAPPQEREQRPDHGPDRPRSMRYPEPIRDSRGNIARALISGLPKKHWRYPEDPENQPTDSLPWAPYG